MDVAALTSVLQKQRGSSPDAAVAASDPDAFLKTLEQTSASRSKDGKSVIRFAAPPALSALPESAQKSSAPDKKADKKADRKASAPPRSSTQKTAQTVAAPRPKGQSPARPNAPQTDIASGVQGEASARLTPPPTPASQTPERRTPPPHAEDKTSADAQETPSLPPTLPLGAPPAALSPVLLPADAGGTNAEAEEAAPPLLAEAPIPALLEEEPAAPPAPTLAPDPFPVFQEDGASEGEISLGEKTPLPQAKLAPEREVALSPSLDAFAVLSGDAALNGAREAPPSPSPLLTPDFAVLQEDAVPTLQSPALQPKGEGTTAPHARPVPQTPLMQAQIQDLAKKIDGAASLSVKIEPRVEPKTEAALSPSLVAEFSAPDAENALQNALQGENRTTDASLDKSASVGSRQTQPFSAGGLQSNGQEKSFYGNGGGQNNGQGGTQNSESPATATATLEESAPTVANAAPSPFQTAVPGKTAPVPAGERSEPASPPPNAARSSSGETSAGTHEIRRGSATARPPDDPLHRAVIDQIKVKITQGGIKTGDKISVQLRPEELGRVEIKLEVRDNRVSAHVVADTADALNALKAEARDLTRALNDAGLKADAGSLQFSLRGNGGQNQHQPHHSGHRPGDPYVSVGQTLEDDPALSPALSFESWQTARAAKRGGVNIRV